jgi:hypothetical protein
MDQVQAPQTAYVCPMHREVHQPRPGKCPKCGMALLPEGTRFGLLKHMLSNPLHVVIMTAIMVLIMAAAMMMWRS